MSKDNNIPRLGSTAYGDSAPLSEWIAKVEKAINEQAASQHRRTYDFLHCRWLVQPDTSQNSHVTGKISVKTFDSIEKFNEFAEATQFPSENFLKFLFAGTEQPFNLNDLIIRDGFRKLVSSFLRPIFESFWTSL